MLSAEWPKTSCFGKRRKREEGKKERKEKKKEKGKKKRKKEEKEKEKGKKRGGGSKQIKKKTKKTTGKYLLILYTFSPLTSPELVPLAGLLGEGPVVLIFRC